VYSGEGGSVDCGCGLLCGTCVQGVWQLEVEVEAMLGWATWSGDAMSKKSGGGGYDNETQ
jgi:hypothetical protein